LPKPILRPDLAKADLRKVELSGYNLSEVDLSEADLRSAKLIATDLVAADLSGVDFRSADLNGANLHAADLEGVDLSYATLTGANLTDTGLWNTTFGEVDLRSVKGLETAHHWGPSIIDINTVYLSKGIIPEIFLRDAGVQNSFIEYMHSLVGLPIDYYTCFISYSSKDQEFAEQLHADLQSKGVRCWFAPEDLKIGETFWDRIDESIHLYDKLLLVLSEHSVESVWVEREVMAALEKEIQQKRLVLFPMRLDDTVKTTRKAWAADIRRSRHIGDFTKWKRHEDYQEAFDRLLRDLKAEPSRTEK
jgi:uncharacterized protein YjbI with pentapeptide repeats